MSDEQKAAASERLAIAREKRLRENPPEYKNIHQNVLSKPDDHMFSFKKVTNYMATTWIQQQLDMKKILGQKR